MTTGDDKPKRLRPRFSVRTLLIVMTLACIYFPAWELTKRNARTRVNATIYGDNDQPLFISDATIPMPFLVVRKEMQTTISGKTVKRERRRRYYMWLFGPLFRVYYTTK